MRKFLKWLGIVVGGLVVLLVLVVVTLGLLGGARLNRTFDIQPETLNIPTDEQSLERGKHLVDVACKSCHGQDLSVQVQADELGPMNACHFGGRFNLATEVTATKAQNPPFGGFRTWHMPSFAFSLMKIYLTPHPMLESPLPEAAWD